MNIVTSVFDKLSLFDNPVELLNFLVDKDVQTAPQEIRDGVIEAFGFLDETSSNQQLQWSRDLVKDIALHQSMPSLLRVFSGEDLSIQITVTDDKDFSGYALTVRKADDSTLLSPDDTAGKPANVEPVQYAYINDVPFTEGQIVKVNVQLEKIDGTGATTGDTVAVITEAYLIMVGTT